MGARHPGHLSHRFQTTTHGPEAPIVEKAAGPDHGFVLPEIGEGLLQIPYAATARPRATDDSQQSRPSSGMLSSVYPPPWHRCGRSTLSLGNAMTRRSCGISPGKKFASSSTRQASQPGSESEIVRCSTSASQQDCASRNWWDSRWKTCRYNERRAFAFSARAGRNAAFRSGRKLPPTCVRG
jgi:hypothetical protein